MKSQCSFLTLVLFFVNFHRRLQIDLLFVNELDIDRLTLTSNIYFSSLYKIVENFKFLVLFFALHCPFTELYAWIY